MSVFNLFNTSDYKGTFVNIPITADYFDIKENILFGTLGKWGKNSGDFFYGDFQSRQLYQWYKQYSHRWLTPGAS